MTAPSPAELLYRPGLPAEAPVAAGVLVAALDDLLIKQNRAPLPAAAAGDVAPVLGHLARSDPQCWVAEHAGAVVGFATAWVRGTLWYLSSLFVLPRWQGRGVGSELLRHAMAGQPAPGGIVAVVSSAANPTSNRLYARRGMYALTPVLYLRGRLATLPPARRRRGVAQLHATPLTTGDLGHLRAVDRAVTGLDRTVDHLWLLGEARRSGWLFRRGESPVAYAYLGGDGTQGDDAVGPIAALTPRDQQVALRFVLAQAADRGSATATLTVPGVNLGAQRMLWQAGFAFDGAAALLCASRPFGRFDRYLLAGDALL